MEIIDDNRTADGYEVVPGTRLVVGRDARKNGTSAGASSYYVNGERSTFENVSKILKRCGIDLTHNRFLILQGEVEMIAQMKSKGAAPGDEGLLEYLEDIIGSHRYVAAIEEAGKALEVLNEHRAEKVNRVRFVEKDKEGLEKSKTEAEEYINAEVAVLQARGKMAQVQAHEAQAAGRDVAAKKEGLEAQLAEERQRLSKADAEMKGTEARYLTAKADCEAVEKAVEKAKADFQVFERKDIKFREDLKHLKAKEKKAAEAVAREDKKRSEAAHAAKTAADDISRAEQAISGVTSRLAAEEKQLSAIFESLKGETGALREALEKKQAELVPKAKAVAEAQSALDVAASERDLVRSQIGADSAALEEAERAHAECAALVGTVGTEFKRVVKEQADNEASLAGAQAKLAAALPKEAQLAASVKDVRARLEGARVAVSDDSSRNKVVQALCKARDSSSLSGIHGRLGDLGSIDPAYDVAISTACPALNHIVVETTADGQKAVDYLRRNNLGRATFIILDKMDHFKRAATSQIETPDSAQRLFDLVQCRAPKFATAFYFALRDTLVAKDLETATKIAFGDNGKRHRVVTLGGDVVDISGTMAGGGGAVSKGLMNLTGSSGSSKASSAASSSGGGSVAESVAALEADLVKTTDSLVKLRGEIESLKQTISACSARKAELDTLVSKLQMRMTSLSMQEPELRGRVEVLRKQPKRDTAAEQARLKALEAQIAGFERDLKRAQGFTQDLEAEIAALQQKIMDAGGVRLRAQKAKVESLKAEVSEASAGITKGRVQISTAEAAQAKADKAIAALEAELARTREEAEQIKADFDKLTGEAATVMQAHKAAERLHAERTEDLQTLAAEYEKVKKASLKLRTREVELANQLEDVAKVHAEAEARARAWGAKLQQARQELAKAVAIPDGGDGGATVPLHGTVPEIPALSEDEIRAVDREQLQYQLTKLESVLAKMEGNVNAIVEYRRREAEYNDRVRELDEVTERRDAQRREHDALRKRRLDCFMAGFSQITLRLKEMYMLITLGGDAELELVDSLDPFAEGIVFSVRPPKKSWKNITNLSGGEKTLSSLALIFALHAYKPNPLFVMDEIDAALDFKNVSIIASYIKERTKDAQFIIISLRNQCFELADRLVGIYKTGNSTQSVTINPAAFATVIQTTQNAAAPPQHQQQMLPIPSQ